MKTIPSNIPESAMRKIQIDKRDFSEGASGRQSNPNSIGINSPDYQYSNYESNNEQNAILQKKYNEILSKRYPNSKSEETTLHQTPARKSSHYK